MRAIVFYIYLCFLLLFGGNFSYADAQHGVVNHSFTQHLSEKPQVKLLNPIKNSVVTEYTDIDLEEEFHSDDDHNDGTANKVLAENRSVLNHWYLIFYHQIIFKDYSQRIKIFAPFCGYSNPIYIRQQVLRI
jgi:hypothetical protein